MHRHVVAHGNHPALAVEHRAGIVAPLLDVGRERGAPQRRAHLFGDGMHGALKDRQLNRVGSAVHALLLDMTMTRFPKPSTWAVQPGGSTVAELYSVIIAGP